ncbi:MAG: hypothetical protein V2B19_00335, partial [Pseudomonadota bacterium]
FYRGIKTNPKKGVARNERNNGFDHRFGQFPTAGRPRQGVFGRAAGCLSDSEFLSVWKKYPGVADTMIKAEITDTKLPESGLGVEQGVAGSKKQRGTGPFNPF